MIDSHCHLDHEPLINNLNDVLERSKKVGIDKLLTISTNINSYKNILNLINQDPMIYGSIGIHPHEVQTSNFEKNYIVQEFKKYQKIIGVGESGLDYYYENSPKETQIESFKIHIEASIECNCPIMHCFTGSKEFAKKLLDLNAYFSASGIITFKNRVELQDTFKFLPNDKILIETDSPFLAPIPMRGKKNEPSFIQYTLQHLSKLKEIDKSSMDNITTQNFETLFFNNEN